MRKAFILCIIMIFIVGLVKAEKQPYVKLKIGHNEVSIKILNKTKTDLKSIELIVA